MTDEFRSFSHGVTAPAIDAAEVTPNDTTDLAYTSRAIYVGTTGDLKVTMRNGSVVTLKNVAAGSSLPYRVKRVWAAGTTATDIVVVW